MTLSLRPPAILAASAAWTALTFVTPAAALHLRSCSLSTFPRTGNGGGKGSRPLPSLLRKQSYTLRGADFAQLAQAGKRGMKQWESSAAGWPRTKNKIRFDKWQKRREQERLDNLAELREMADLSLSRGRYDHVKAAAASKKVQVRCAGSASSQSQSGKADGSREESAHTSASRRYHEGVTRRMKARSYGLACLEPSPSPVSTGGKSQSAKSGKSKKSDSPETPCRHQSLLREQQKRLRARARREKDAPAKRLAELKLAADARKHDEDFRRAKAREDHKWELIRVSEVVEKGRRARLARERIEIEKSLGIYEKKQRKIGDHQLYKDLLQKERDWQQKRLDTQYVDMRRLDQALLQYKLDRDDRARRLLRGEGRTEEV